MKRLSWLFFTARRWMNIGRHDRSVTSTVLAIIGIATGVMTLYTVLGVMNGFQTGFIESILEIGSFHARLSVPETSSLSVSKKISKIKNIKSVLPFFETQNLVRGLSGESLPVLTRGIPGDSQELDSSFISCLNIKRGHLPFNSEEILIGEELSFWLRVSDGDTISLISVQSSDEEGLIPISKTYSVSGIFKSGYYEYDLARAFIFLDNSPVQKSTGDQVEIVLGIKFKDKNEDKATIKEIVHETGFKPESWRDYNKSFFGALKMEKNLMMIVIGLIFIVVSINIFHALRRSVRERLEDIGVLRALGASSFEIRCIFILEGVFIGLIGSLVGLIIGLLITENVNELFKQVENFVNLIIESTNFFSGIGKKPDFALFSPSFFYLSNIPVKVYPDESIIIFFLGFASSIFAAFFASRKTLSLVPQEVLRNE